MVYFAPVNKTKGWGRLVKWRCAQVRIQFNAEKRFHAASLFSFLREGINNISALLSVTYI